MRELETLLRANVAVVLVALIASACAERTEPEPNSHSSTTDPVCEQTVAGQKELYWGDLHVHTAYSLDAYGWGTVATPADAYRFAKGEAIDLPDGTSVELSRPLDFTAVTDHAEWFDLMYVCTNPLFEEDEYCELLREKSRPDTGGQVFANYVIPTITLERPQVTPICENDPQKCLEAFDSQWSRIQEQAHEANEPCSFTTFVGFEWSATPAFSHTHRNVIFANENVTDQAIDYIRYPELEDLWRELDTRCRAEDGCDAITIPHNNNMGDGTTFDIETDDERTLDFRRRFERLVEIHQEKGSSECLSPFGSTDEQDCSFEIYLTRRSRQVMKEDLTEPEWNQIRKTYVRTLLLRGLEAHARDRYGKGNPVRLGIVGSTDNHTATPGHVDEDSWFGSAFGFGELGRAMSRVDWNPGGLTAIWAEENTRPSLFAAMKRREVYATSGPRIELRFDAIPSGGELACGDAQTALDGAVPMGGELAHEALRSGAAPSFRVLVHQDKVPLERIEIVKGEWRDGDARESVIDVTPRDLGAGACVVWSDPEFDAASPAFWYVRVQQEATSRWSATMCREAGRCEEYPEAEREIRERAWSSPIWYLSPKESGAEG